MSPLAVVGIAIVSLGLWIGARMSRHRAEGFWAVAWGSALASGAILMLAPPSLAALLIAYLGPVFPAGQLAGAMAFTRGRAPLWIVPAALALGLLRLASIQWGFQGLVQWIPWGVEPAGTLAAAFLLYRAARSRGSPLPLTVLPALLVLAAFCDLLTAASDLVATGLAVPVGVLWVSLLVLGLPMQLNLAGGRYARYQAKLRRRVEAELDESQLRFRALAEAAFDLIAEIDDDERFTYVNPRYEEVLGYPPEAMLGCRPVEFMHPDDVEVARRFAEPDIETDGVGDHALRIRRNDGSYISIETAARSFVAPDGRRRTVLNSRDVSDRMLRDREHARLEQSVLDSEGRFRALTENAPALISEFDDHGRYTFANESFRELLGIDPSTLVGTIPVDLIHPDDLAGSRAGMIEALRHESTTVALHRLRHADGSWRWFENTGRAYRTGNGELRFVSMGRDVTEARRQAEERRELEHQMREVQRLDSLGVLAGGIAHDFNNLLAVILGNVALLESADLAEEAQGRLRRIRSAAAHAEALTDQMLTYAGKSVADLVPLDLSKLVSETEDLLRATVGVKGVLEIELDTDLPSVRGDATQLRQVLINLVANATDALASTGRRGSVRVHTDQVELTTAELADGFGTSDRPPGTWVLLEVSDDGPGMDAAVRSRIFEPFFTTKATGRGLGLSAVLGITSAHDGVLKLESEPGLYTRFRLLLRPSGEEVRAPQRGFRLGPAVQRDARILVVDDDEAVREIAQIFLERGGFQVEAAAGGNEALSAIARGESIDAVLLDLEMPNPSGTLLLEKLRRERPGLPVVIASGYKRELAAERLEGSETCGFVQKPFDPEDLLAAVDEALRNRARS